MEIANNLYRQVSGVAKANRTYKVSMNVMPGNLDALIGYLKAEHLFADCPTVIGRPREMHTITVLIEKDRYAHACDSLIHKYGATSIMAEDVKHLVG